MITCPECGAPVDTHRRRCAECGHALAATERQPAVATRAQPEMLGDDDFLPEESATDVSEDPGALRGSPGVWRQGDLLVIRKGAVLPPRCVKSNEPAEVTLKRTMYWHHPAIYLIIFLGLLIYVIVALIVRKTAVVEIGLTRKLLSRRRWGIATGWLIALGGVGLFVVAAAVDSSDVSPFLVIAGFLCLFVIGPVYGLLRSQLVSPKKITDEFAWIKGVHPAYLAELREFPGEGEWQ